MSKQQNKATNECTLPRLSYRGARKQKMPWSQGAEPVFRGSGVLGGAEVGDQALRDDRSWSGNQGHAWVGGGSTPDRDAG